MVPCSKWQEADCWGNTTLTLTHPNTEDAIEVTRHTVRGHEDWAKKQGGGGQGGGGDRGGPNQPEKRLEDMDDMDISPPQLMDRYRQYSQNTQMALSRLDHNAIDYSLVCQTLAWLSTLRSPKDAKMYLNNQRPSRNDEGGGSNMGDAILVFLPGIKEITTVLEMLLSTPEFNREPARSWVLPIHSTIPPEDQRLVFTRPPPGVRKVVLATNIAETAITIDDVAFVVDTGRMKENRYLEDCLVSRANVRQRRGRAGRVREGVAVHLFTKHRHDKICEAAQAPEVQRVPLEQLLLRIKALKYPGTVGQVCAQLIEPPSPEAVQRALDELVFLEAVTVDRKGNESLTALGMHLSTLPVDCRIGKQADLTLPFTQPNHHHNHNHNHNHKQL